MSRKVKKIIRILEYVGDEAWLTEQMRRNYVQGTYYLSDNRWIREVYISPAQDISISVASPDIIAEPEKKNDNNVGRGKSAEQDIATGPSPILRGEEA